jgi:hypothetical protein
MIQGNMACEGHYRDHPNQRVARGQTLLKKQKAGNYKSYHFLRVCGLKESESDDLRTCSPHFGVKDQQFY